MRKKIQQTKKMNSQVLFNIYLMVLALVLVIVIIIAFQKNWKTVNMEAAPIPIPSEEAPQEEKWQEGMVSYNGKYYKYNNNLRTYLLLGIDKEGPAVEAENSISGGQSDAMFLIVANSEDESIFVISINRNTMTKIKTLDPTGEKKGEITAQICVQHGFGDGRHYSCSQTVDTVSNLFYNLPISGYISLNMGAVPILNDAVGGVEVTALQEINDPERGVFLPGGQMKTLSGIEAYSYLRVRDTNVFDSASDRLRRQEQYIGEYMKKLKTAVAGDASKAADIYNSVSEYLVADVDFANLISELVTYRFDESRMYTVPGKTTMGEVYEEYYVDDDALYDLIIQVFYREVEP